MRYWRVLGVLSAELMLVAAASPSVSCEQTTCSVRLSPEQLLRAAERLTLERRFAEATPLIAALAEAPGYSFEQQFLEGYVAAETGDPKTAVKRFRSVLAMRPDSTRARLELARTLMMLGRDAAADYHYRLAQEDGELPPEVGRTIYAARNLIRSRQRFELNFTVGFAPDTNINSATADRTFDANFGGSTVPLELDNDARKRTGVGQTGQVWGSFRFPLADEVRLLVEADGRAVNYAGSRADDVSTVAAIGPEWQRGDARLIVSATAGQRWYGGEVAQRSYGSRIIAQQVIGSGARLGAQFDARRVRSGFNEGLDGWSLGSSFTFERVINRSFVGSVTAFGLWEPLRSKAYSSMETGLAAGVGGELPFGINAGVSGSASRAWYDGAIPLFGDKARDDWRFHARVYVGPRNRRYLGFSPSIAYSYRSASSNIDLYDFARHRLEFSLARYF